MGTIKVEWLNDDHDCEICGSSYADGARVWLDGDLILELEPVAHCYESRHYDEADVYRRILEWMGHRIEEPKP